MLIRPTHLVLKQIFFWNLLFVARLVGLISIKTKEYFIWPPLWKRSIADNLGAFCWTKKYSLLAAFLITSFILVFHDRSLVIILPCNFALSTSSNSFTCTLIGLNIALFPVKEIRSSLHFSLLNWTLLAKDHSATLSAIIWALLTSPVPTNSATKLQGLEGIPI